MQIIPDTLSQIEIGPPVTSGNFTMFPLLNGTEDYPDYLTLDEALTKGIATVTEISESGSIPELRFVNTGDLSVLLMDGEELIGAKQNRILNLTILAGAHSELKIPVSCVERGRWSSRAAAFQSGTTAQFATARANRVASVTSSLSMSGRPDSDQSEVWGDIDQLASDLKVESTTSAMADMFQSYSSKLAECASELPAVDKQVGAMFAINGYIIGFDLFDRASTLSKLLPKLISSYALQALSQKTVEMFRPPTKEAARELLNAVSNSQGRSFTAMGEGEDVRIEGSGLSAAALIAKGRLIHLCGFRVNRDPYGSIKIARQQRGRTQLLCE